MSLKVVFLFLIFYSIPGICESNFYFNLDTTDSNAHSSDDAGGSVKNYSNGVTYVGRVPPNTSFASPSSGTGVVYVGREPETRSFSAPQGDPDIHPGDGVIEVRKIRK